MYAESHQEGKKDNRSTVEENEFPSEEINRMASKNGNCKNELSIDKRMVLSNRIVSVVSIFLSINTSASNSFFENYERVWQGAIWQCVRVNVLARWRNWLPSLLVAVRCAG